MGLKEMNAVIPVDARSSRFARAPFSKNDGVPSRMSIQRIELGIGHR
jgi:hypothetical protein